MAVVGNRPLCTAHSKKGKACGNPAILGATVCRFHGGNAPQVQARAKIRSELASWRLGDAVDDPIETLLRMITQSRARADFLADLLQRAYDAAERIAEDSRTDPAADGDARRDLEHVLQTGGISALIGKTYGAAGKDGDIYATGEAIRGLALLESTERDRCARFCKLAIDAGLSERMVRIAEKQAAIVNDVMRGALEDAGLADHATEVLGHAGRRLRLVTG